MDGARKLIIDRTRVDKYNKIGILIDGAQNDTFPFVASGAVNWGVITASQIIGRTECVNYAGTGSCPTVGLLTTGPLFGQDGLRVTSGSYATVDSSLISQNLVNGEGAPTRNSATNNANLTLAAGARYVAAKIALYDSATGQVVYSRLGTSNIVDNAYGVLNVAADGTTAVTGNPNATELQSQGNLLKAENNWWGLRFNSADQPRPGDLADHQPAGAGEPGQRHRHGRDGQRRDDLQRGRLLPVSQRAAVGSDQRRVPDPDRADPGRRRRPDGLPDRARRAPPAARTITLIASASDDFGIKRVRFAEGATTLGTATTPPYTVNVHDPGQRGLQHRPHVQRDRDGLARPDHVGHRAGHRVLRRPAAPTDDRGRTATATPARRTPRRRTRPPRRAPARRPCRSSPGRARSRASPASSFDASAAGRPEVGGRDPRQRARCAS